MILKTNEVLCQALAADLTEYCAANENSIDVQSLPEDYQHFFAAQTGGIDIHFYLTRLLEYANCSKSCFITALVLLHRVQVRARALAITTRNCHRLYHTALLIAIKLLEDEVYTIDYYAAVFGVSPEDLIHLERVMLRILNWNILVKPQIFEQYKQALNRASSSCQNSDATDDEFEQPPTVIAL